MAKIIDAVTVIWFAVLFIEGASTAANADNRQALIGAAEKGQLENFKRLLDAGVDVNAENRNG